MRQADKSGSDSITRDELLPAVGVWTALMRSAVVERKKKDPFAIENALLSKQGTPSASPCAHARAPRPSVRVRVSICARCDLGPAAHPLPWTSLTPFLACSGAHAKKRNEYLRRQRLKQAEENKKRLDAWFDEFDKDKTG